MINDTDALLVALQSLGRIEDTAEEIAAHNYQDSTTIDLCRDIEIVIQDLHRFLKDRGSQAFKDYIDIEEHRIAEADHP